jgi:hypothetical protein
MKKRLNYHQPTTMEEQKKKQEIAKTKLKRENMCSSRITTTTNETPAIAGPTCTVVIKSGPRKDNVCGKTRCNTHRRQHINCLNDQLICASKAGDLELVKTLHSDGAVITAQDNWALRWAIKKNHEPVMEYLRANGGVIDPNENGL